ncbi:MAG: GIY-YIG nuclease family protein, partial [Gammaproteobacteria bacterium]|nr:GIY-YIG nuclease family protein [Gammaproteobacteria bacterium]
MDKKRAAGIYVYTLPHYLRHPKQPADDPGYSSNKTLLKVGMSDRDVLERVRQQGTGLPEPPVLLRVFTSKDRPLTEVEATMHKLLGAFDHNPNRERGAGKEWFLTLLPALDALASV